MSSPTSGGPSDVSVVGRYRRPLLVLAGLVVVIGVLVVVVTVGDGILANRFWFNSLGDQSVYDRKLLTEVVLYAIFGGAMVVVLTASIAAALRWRGDFVPDPNGQRVRAFYHRRLHRWRHWIAVIAVIWTATSIGARAASSWLTWLAWRNAVPFGQRDPEFHRNAAYYVDIYPLHRLVLTLSFRIVAAAIIAQLVIAFLYGSLRLRGPGHKTTPAFRAQLSLLVGVYLLLKAAAYWLDRMALVTSNRGVTTGVSYVDAHYESPDKLVLIVIALVAALALLVNVAVRGSRLLWLGVGVMAIGAAVFGVVIPAVAAKFQVSPSASTLQLPYISHNLAATRYAYGLGDVTTEQQDTIGSTSAQSTGSASLASQAAANAQYRLLDPNRMSPTFTTLQALASYYKFTNTLNVGVYDINGTERDVVLGVRELNQKGLPSQSWTNQHVIYTHGYGVVAAVSSKVNSKGEPEFVSSGLTGSSVLGRFRPQIYYGQSSPGYSIVGAPTGSSSIEFDKPTGSSCQPCYTTHTGGGGVPISSLWHRLVYAVKLQSTSVLFSSDINHDSQLLYNRNPASRVAAVAPWLTVDGDPYPAIVDGQVDWVMDGYTTSNAYPDSQQQSLGSAARTTLTANGAEKNQSSASVNYIRDSVKAVVNAYTGKVTLYAWNQAAQPDPLLQTYERAFPGLVQPQSTMPAALVGQVRYPTDLFNLQRTMLLKYHVTSAAGFYNGGDFWRVPADPTFSSTTSTNALGNTVTSSAAAIPSTYMTMSADGRASPTYSLSTPLVTLNNRNLAALLTVDARPGPGYGRMTLLRIPSAAVQAPTQIQNQIESDANVAKKLSLLRQGKANVVIGNMLTVPVGNSSILYVEPVYVQSSGPGSYPTLQYVVADDSAEPNLSFEPTLARALRGAFNPPPSTTGTSSSKSSGTASGSTTSPTSSPTAIAGDSPAG